MPAPPEQSVTPHEAPSKARAGATVWILLATVFAIMAVPFTDSRNVGIPHRYWELHNRCLDDLADALVKYRNLHGTYPDNDQGLYALDTFGARFEVAIDDLRGKKDSTKTNSHPALFLEGRVHRTFWLIVQEQIPRFHAWKGRPPANAEELGMPWLAPTEPPTGPDARRAEIAITDHDQLFFLAPGCVLDPSLTPYVYENRNGRDESAFADSIANSDWRRKFSREPAPGIFISSHNARDCYLAYRDQFIARYSRVWGAGALSLACWIVAIRRTRRFRGRKWPLVIPAIGAFLASGLGTGSFVTCYITRAIPWRKPESVEAQKRLLEKFHRDGVIRGDTYQTALQGFETQAVFPPAETRSREPK